MLNMKVFDTYSHGQEECTHSSLQNQKRVIMTTFYYWVTSNENIKRLILVLTDRTVYEFTVNIKELTLERKNK